MSSPDLHSIPRVADVQWVRGTGAATGAAPDLVLEVPHGATTQAHFDALRAELRGPFAADLKEFYFVNTDVGAPEVAHAVAHRVVQEEPTRCAIVIRCLIPRTFIDCNRMINATDRPATSQAGALTPGIASYVTHPEDLALLLERYGAYRSLVERAFEQVCADPRTPRLEDAKVGQGVMVHTYAPRSVDVIVDDQIVTRLREAYQPDQVERWPLRPAVDLITRDDQGTQLASERLVTRTRAAYERTGLHVGDSEAYHLHSATVAHALAQRYLGRTLCLELRRDLIVREFTPFQEMGIDTQKVQHMALPLAEALHH